ncbi:hypothetical protein H5410_004228, partial [Solanum commersonii]
MKQKHIDSLLLELFSMNIFDTLRSTKVQKKIKLISEQIAIDIFVDHPNAFWNRKNHIITLPYEDTFSEDDIPTKSRPCQMNDELVELCKKEIDSLLQKGLLKMMLMISNHTKRMEPPWVTKGRGKGNNPRGRRRYSPSSSRSSYGSSSNSPIIQRGGMSLFNLNSKAQEAASSVHLEDIPENNPLYAQLHAYLSQKKSDTFASIAKDDVDDIKSYEKVEKREMMMMMMN